MRQTIVILDASNALFKLPRNLFRRLDIFFIINSAYGFIPVLHQIIEHIRTPVDSFLQMTNGLFSSVTQDGIEDSEKLCGGPANSLNYFLLMILLVHISS